MTADRNLEPNSVHLAGETGDGRIDRFELDAAHRALALLKAQLGRERILELLRTEISQGDAFLRRAVTNSAGRTLTGTTTLVAQGITAVQFTGWLATAFGREDVLLAGHPEHYSIHPVAGRVNIVETLGNHVCSFFMQEWDGSIVGDDDAGPASRRSMMALEDGTVVGTIANTFEDCPGGFTARLSVTLPEDCGRTVIDHHLHHFAVEFRNWIRRAAGEISSPAAR